MMVRIRRLAASRKGWGFGALGSAGFWRRRERGKGMPRPTDQTLGAKRAAASAATSMMRPGLMQPSVSFPARSSALQSRPRERARRLGSLPEQPVVTVTANSREEAEQVFRKVSQVLELLGHNIIASVDLPGMPEPESKP